MLDRPTIGPRIDELLDAVWQAGGTDLLLTVGHAAADAGPRRAAARCPGTRALTGERHRRPAGRAAHRRRRRPRWTCAASTTSRSAGATWPGSAATRSASAASPRSRCGSIPRADPDHGRAGPAADRCARSPACTRAWSWSPGRPARASRPRSPSMIDQINTRAGLPHPHHRGPDRVRARAQARDRSTSARSALDTASFADALRVGAAGGPRRAARRRDARPRVDPVRADHRRDRPPRASPRCTPTTPRRRWPASSTSSRPSSRRRSARSSPPR